MEPGMGVEPIETALLPLGVSLLGTTVSSCFSMLHPFLRFLRNLAYEKKLSLGFAVKSITSLRILVF